MSTFSKIARWWVMGRKGMSDPLITVVKMNGVLQAPSGRGPAARSRTLNLDRVEKWLQRAFLKDLRPAACAISINSPGGSPVQSELIHDMICRLKRQTGIPVFTFAEDVAASGGYWLMCAGDQAYGCSTSLVGSIGVVSATVGAVQLSEKLGVERRIFTAGPSKVPLDPFLPVTEDQKARLLDIMTDMHAAFQNTVKQSRGERLNAPDEELFSGRAWTGQQAVKLGLLDGIGTLRGVMREKFGDKARFLLCSEPPQPSIRDVLGFGSFLGRKNGSFGTRGGVESEDVGSSIEKLEGLLSSEAGYGAVRAAVRAALDEAEERAMWDKYKLH